MVKASFRLKLDKYKADKSGYPGVMNASAVQGILGSKADAVCRAANGAAQPGAAYTVATLNGRLANGYMVSTGASSDAAADEYLHKTLTKAAHAAGGGR